MARSTRSRITVDSEANAPITVNVTSDDVAVHAFTDRIGGTEITLPLVVSSRTNLWVAKGTYTLTCTWKGVVVKTVVLRFPGANSAANVTVTKVDIDLAELGNAIGSGGGDTIFGQGLTGGFPVILEDCQAVAVGYEGAPFAASTFNDNGGVGDTIVADADGVFMDGSYAPDQGARIAVFNQAAQIFGVFTLTDTGSESTPWTLTRATDLDTLATYYRFWAVRITHGDRFDGGWMYVTTVENPLTQDSFPGTGLWVALNNSRHGLTLGPSAISASISGVAVGESATASGGGSTAVGTSSLASGASSGAFGYNSRATAEGATAIGNSCVADEEGVTKVDGGRGAKVIVMSPDETKWAITVANDGTLSATAV